MKQYDICIYKGKECDNMEVIVAFIYAISYFIFGVLVGYSVCAILDYSQKLIRKLVDRSKK